VFEKLAHAAPRRPISGAAFVCREILGPFHRSLFRRLGARGRIADSRPKSPVLERAQLRRTHQRLLASIANGRSRTESVAPERRRRRRTAIFCGLFLGLGWLEIDRSWLEAQIVPRLDSGVSFQVDPGPSRSIRFPTYGPYDRRLGYTQIPIMIERLNDKNFALEQQSRMSPRMLHYLELGGYAVFHEKSQAGLIVRDASGKALVDAAYPTRTFRNFEEIPPLLVQTLRFIEDREVLDPTHPSRNPAVDWSRFAVAAVGQLGGAIDRDWRQGGASTLATQLEKFRHSPDGRTVGVSDKIRQMATATARAYLDGSDLQAAQEQILTSYLNSTPLGSRPGFGEVIGLGDGLFAWYGVDWPQARRCLAVGDPAQFVDTHCRALVYKQALSLLIAQRRPSFFLSEGREQLERRTDVYLRGLAAARVIDRALRDQALALKLEFASGPPTVPQFSFVERKAADAIRKELLSTLGLSSLYTLDRLDVQAEATIDVATQRRVANVFEQLKNPGAVQALGLVGEHLLGNADPAKVAWSFLLCERGPDRNRIRVRIDNLDQPFDINSGAKLMLGSTAKLRALATYLGIIEQLRRELDGLPRPDLRQIASRSDDPLRQWVAAYLATASDADSRIGPTLEAAMHRHYSASPDETFFTGGGIHVFHNFEPWEDSKNPTVEEAFANSINLAFVRLLRDVVQHYESQNLAVDADNGQTDDGIRAQYLRIFADREGRVYLRRFEDEYQGLSPEATLERLAQHAKRNPRSLAIVFRSARPYASKVAMRRFLVRQRADVASIQELDELYARYAPDNLSLSDRSYLAGVHPLEMWLVAFRDEHPDAVASQEIAASEEARQEAYAWLLRSKDRRQQDSRIKTVLEQDAFEKLLIDWNRQGYPFTHLVPSLATAIGSSGDRADALATLVGIILNDGVWQPMSDLEQVTLAPATPYETQMTYRSALPQRVFSTDVAAALKRALVSVVDEGTGIMVRDAFVAPNGKPIAIGGKTGTGDNRFDTFAGGLQLKESRAVNRTATFVFFLGDRFFGTVTAYVSGPQSDQYHFSSALAVSLLRDLAPELRPLVTAKTVQRQ